MENDKDSNTDNSKGFWAVAIKLFYNTLDLPPYYPIFFFSGVLVVSSVFSESLQLLGQGVFLYAIAGIFWRHLTVDLRKLLDIKKSKSITHWQNWVITIIYHIGNIALFLSLLKYLSVFVK